MNPARHRDQGLLGGVVDVRRVGQHPPGPAVCEPSNMNLVQQFLKIPAGPGGGPFRQFLEIVVRHPEMV
ncbi:hypothetical protein L3i22_057100 [Actinoplanes sp. L3-i22]|nr:hypothetical protein L3i22_057100 [Actinoplanes sp. L3-i22]